MVRLHRRFSSENAVRGSARLTERRIVTIEDCCTVSDTLRDPGAFMRSRLEARTTPRCGSDQLRVRPHAARATRFRDLLRDAPARCGRSGSTAVSRRRSPHQRVFSTAAGAEIAGMAAPNPQYGWGMVKAADGDEEEGSAAGEQPKATGCPAGLRSTRRPAAPDQSSARWGTSAGADARGFQDPVDAGCPGAAGLIERGAPGGRAFPAGRNSLARSTNFRHRRPGLIFEELFLFQLGTAAAAARRRGRKPRPVSHNREGPASDRSVLRSS